MLLSEIKRYVGDSGGGFGLFMYTRLYYLCPPKFEFLGSVHDCCQIYIQKISVPRVSRHTLLSLEVV